MSSVNTSNTANKVLVAALFLALVVVSAALPPWFAVPVVLQGTPVPPPDTSYYYVATNGTAGGDGSIGNPWDIYTVFSGNSVAISGDTVWIRSGSYSNLAGFTNTVSGLKLKAYTNSFASRELVLLQGRTFELTNETEIYDIWLQGADTARVSTNSGSAPNDVEIRNGFKPTGPNVKIINCIVSDILGFGVGAGTNAHGLTVYGTHSMFNGWEAPDRGHGHNYYFQNRLDTMTVKHSSSFAAMNNNFQARSSEPTNCQNLYFDGFVSWQSARMTTNYTGGYEFEVGESFTSNIWVHQLLTFNNFVTNGVSLFGGDSGAANDGLTISNSIIGTDLRLVEWTNSVFLSNTVFAHTRVLDMDQTYAPASAWNMDSNNWFSHEWGFGEFDYPGGTGGHVDFTNTTGLDINGTYTTGAPSGTNVITWINDYETNRAFVTIYNWASNDNVIVNCDLFLVTDDTYRVVNMEDPGGEVMTGTYNGSVSLPMTNLAIHIPVGHDVVAATGPGFGKFKIEKTGVSSYSTAVPTNGLIAYWSATTNIISGNTDPALRGYKGDGESNIAWTASRSLDTASLTNWAGTSNVTVTTWHDQWSTNNATNSTASAQPRIYNGSVVDDGLYFDGTSDALFIPDPNESTSTLSVFVWWNSTNSVGNMQAISHYYTVLNQRSWFISTASTGWGADGNELGVLISKDGTTSEGSYKAYYVDQNVADGVWHHVGFTFTNNTLTLYIDGTGGIATKYKDGTVSTLRDSTAELAIGTINPPSPSLWWPGFLDDVAIYNKVLTTDEIQQLYTNSVHYVP